MPAPSPTARLAPNAPLPEEKSLNRVERRGATTRFAGPQPLATAERRQVIAQTAQQSHGDSHGRYATDGSIVTWPRKQDPVLPGDNASQRGRSGALFGLWCSVCFTEGMREVDTASRDNELIPQGRPGAIAMLQNFFDPFKAEWIATGYATEKEPCMEVFKYVEMFYSPTRRHSTRGYRGQAKYKCRGETGRLTLRTRKPGESCPCSHRP